MADRDLQDVIDLLGRTSTDLGTMADDFSRPQGQPHSSQRKEAGNPELTRALEELLRKKGLSGDGSSSEQDVAMGGFSGAASLPVQTSEPWPASTATRLSEPWSVGERADRPADSGGIDAYSQDLSKQRSLMQSGVDAQTTSMIDAKATTRARNAMEKRRLREEMTGERQPGLGYEETLTQERIKVEREFEEDRQKRKGAKAAGGMTTMDVLTGKAPPKVGGEFVFPPGDMRNSPAYQKAKAAADEAQIVSEIPDDEQLGGKDPRDTEPMNEPDKGGSLPTDKVKGPGDVRRLSAQRKLDQLHNLRSIAEGGMRMGNLAVAGDYVPGQTPRAGLSQQPRAEGIRAEIARVTGDESLFLKSQLKREEQRELSGLRSEEEDFKFKLENMGVTALNLTGRQAKELWIDSDKWIHGDTVKKANKALSAVRAGLESLREGPGGEAPLGQAQVLAARQVLQAYGEGSRMSDQDIEGILLSPQFAGMYDRVYRFLTGRATPATVALYKDMLNRLDKATKEHFIDIRDRRAQRFTDFWGAPKSEVLKAYGTIFEEEGAGGVSGVMVPMVHTKTRKTKNVHEDDVPKAETRGWARAGT